MIQYDEALNLASCRPRGAFDIKMADELLCFLQAMETAIPVAFHRLLDLEGIVEIHLSGTDLYRIARARRAAAQKLPVCRSAIFAPSLLTYAIAKIYESLMAGSNIQVGVFEDEKSTAEWLRLPQSALGLEDPKSGGTESARNPSNGEP